MTGHGRIYIALGVAEVAVGLAAPIAVALLLGFGLWAGLMAIVLPCWVAARVAVSWWHRR